MDLTSKQRAYLKSLAGNMDAIFQIGKASLTPSVTDAVNDALEKRELVKISVLKNCFDDPKELANILAERTHSNVVQVIGKKFVLYRPSKKAPKIELPAAKSSK
ncbi:MAG: ribosome assembly RNA-binding protein YhbY [Eubacterium sp.]|nr:ribosome assembly RNA-binding protein YhbY [Eubacterium sp.]